MVDFRKEFPVLSEYTYLNTPSCGLLSKSLVQWRSDHDQNLLEGGSLFRDQHKAHIRSIRANVAHFFSASEDEVALVPNFSFGQNALLDGLPSGLKVLMVKGDYPSVNWPIEHRDFNVCYVELGPDLEDQILKAVESHNPDVLSLSMVQYISGVKIDLSFIRELKSNYPDLLIFGDGTQYLGTETYCFSESGFDVVGASCYKWMNSGYGNGLYLIKKEAQNRIWPKTIGFNSADAQFSKKNEIEFVGRLEPGHQDTLNYGSIDVAIKYREQLGLEATNAQLQSLVRKARERFMELDLLDDKVSQRSSTSTIFNLKGDQRYFEALKREKIIASLRGKGIRVGFHFYNTEEDLERLLEVWTGIQ